MNYYAYEYSVLQLLLNELQITNVDINRDTTDAYTWIHNEDDKLEYTCVLQWEGDRMITINFEHDFHYTFNSKVLVDSYESNVEAEEVAMVLKQNIIDAFTKEFILK